MMGLCDFSLLPFPNSFSKHDSSLEPFHHSEHDMQANSLFNFAWVGENKLQQYQVLFVKADDASVYWIEADAGVNNSGTLSLKRPRRSNIGRATGPGDVCCLMWAPLTHMTKLLGNGRLGRFLCLICQKGWDHHLTNPVFWIFLLSRYCKPPFHTFS